MAEFLRVRIEIQGVVKFDRAMVVAENRMGRPLSEIGGDLMGVLEEETVRHIMSKGAYTGKYFPRLSPRYAAWKKRMERLHPGTYPGGGPMRLTHDLLKSLSPGAEGQNAIRIFRDDYIIYGTGVEYAGHLDRNRRPPVRLGKPTKKRIEEVMRVWAIGVVREGVEGPPGFKRAA